MYYKEFWFVPPTPTPFFGHSFLPYTCGVNERLYAQTVTSPFLLSFFFRLLFLLATTAGHDGWRPAKLFYRT